MVTDICRTCMKNEGKFRSIFSSNKKQASTYSDMLKICISLHVTENDGLPKQICSKCVYNLSALYQFRQTCVKSDKILRELLNNKTSKCDIIEPNLTSIPIPIKDDENDSENEINLFPGPDELDLDNKIDENLVEIQIKTEIIQDNISQETVPIENSFEEQKKSKKKTDDIKKRPAKAYQCEICGKFLSCHSNLIQHRRKHTGERPFKCDFCGKAFSRAEHLTIHRRIHTGERPHSCDVCGKSFVQYAALACHIRTHTGERPHACPACGKTFAQAVTLTYHMRTHTGETPYICSVCGKGFTHSGNLNIHMRFHNGERPFVCNECGQRFVTSSHLSVHIKQHTGERNHRCVACGKAFLRKEHLRAHVTSHTGQKPHGCNLCGKRYSQSSHLSRHMKTHRTMQAQQHGGQMDLEQQLL